MHVRFASLDYSLDQHNQEHQMKQISLGESRGVNSNGHDDYMLNNNVQHQHHLGSSASPEKLSFADVMQFADIGPKLALNHTNVFRRFPVLLNDLDDQTSLMMPHPLEQNEEDRATFGVEEARVSDSISEQHRFLGEDLVKKDHVPEVKNKRKRMRSMKTSEEVESERMTHIAVERNRRKQMNEHLLVLRSLMPGSYVQRGDQASIIGGAIEFVRELEQLLQCLESQKHRRLFGDAPRQMGGDLSLEIQQPDRQPQFLPPLSLPIEPMSLLDFEKGIQEETAESKSCLADIEVELLGCDALSRFSLGEGLAS